ncbi:hypothetical protein RRG08_012677 [Elysia crispata]|uniref:Uncharacterized protein n=1 Tax=Elysia crispata TaxID=231223 RepID=A0AAE0YPE3_9GAST|nr:hypothetical protein RRG08_012677 [Elysia crispata]
MPGHQLNKERDCEGGDSGEEEESRNLKKNLRETVGLLGTSSPGAKTEKAVGGVKMHRCPSVISSLPKATKSPRGKPI